jgi:hypothetical protein
MNIIERTLWQWSIIPSSITPLTSYDESLIESGWQSLQPLTSFKLRALHCRGIHLHRTVGIGGNGALIELAHIAEAHSLTYRRPERGDGIKAGTQDDSRTCVKLERVAIAGGVGWVGLDTPSIGARNR